MSVEDTAIYERLMDQEHTHQRLPTATISGGVPITGWKQVSGNTYSAVVPSLAFVNQLFINNQRIVRTRVPTNYSDYLHYAAPLNDSTKVRYGFQYMPGQFDYKSLTDAMVIIYHSWTESHHYIDQLITSNNTVLFSNPSQYAIGEFAIQGQRRFHIENLCEALVPNSFCFVNETKTVYLMTNGSYDPTKVEIITSVNEIVVSLASDDATNPVEDVIIDNVAIQHGAWNITRTAQANSASASFLTSVALFIANATSIVVSNVEISHTGSYGVRIREGTSNIILINSIVTDTGAGGVWVGDWSTPVSILANSNKIISNEISYGGNVFPSGVGVLVFRSFDIVIADNSIHHHRYNGISIGSQNGYSESLTTKILVLENYIYNIGQHILCDQGGIYTIGVQPGTVIHGNVVKNVFSYATFMWGIYLDDGASDMIVSNNVVYNTGWASLFQHYGANNTIVNNVFARASLIPPPQPGDPFPDGDVRIQEAENHTSWTYTQNIVYDSFQGANHSAIKTNPKVIASFNNNVYYNLYGTPLLFGSQQTSFAEWQKIGQDNNSMIADPLFVGDVNQCDFFTVQSNSPAAKLGFLNITKPSKWTPGCDVDNGNNKNQFYHW
jgi:parallel beta-helix repeat protein